jgi:hypothetical protein
MKIFRIFRPKFFPFLLFKFVGKNKKIATLTFFIDTYIFSDRRLKNHKIIIFYFLSTFLEIL